MNGNAGTPQTPEQLRETIRSIVERNRTTDPEVTVRQLMYVIPEPQELPTLEQMQELINLAYGLGWKDRRYAIWNTTPPTVTIAPRPDGTWLFLYDGKPRP